jgi:hypothetical protein
MTTRRVKPVITVSSAFEEFTVKTAEALLAQNDSNRSIREAKVEQYARDMRNGNWNLCTGPIVVDVDGKLIDGQHRLTAQIRAGIKIKWLVLRNVDSDVQRTIDTGAMRSAADVLHFAGEQYSQQLATAARLVHRIKTNTMTGRGGYSVSNEEILQVVESEPMLRHSVQISATSNRGGRMTPISPSVMAAAHWLIAQANGEEEATSFVTRVFTLSREREGSPVLALNRRANELSRQNIRVKTRDWLALVIKAWNYDAEGKAVNKLALYTKSGEYVLPDVAIRKHNAFVIEDLDEEDELIVPGGVNGDDATDEKDKKESA